MRPQPQRHLRVVPTVPVQSPRSLGLMFAVAAALFALGGLVQINPIWLWGPYEVSLSTNGAQPDWYLGWLIGGLRLMPGFDVALGDYTLIPNPFWGGVLFPLVVMGLLITLPWTERRLTGDRQAHNVLDRPRDAPGRTGFALAFLTWVGLVFVAGSADRATVFFGLDYVGQIWFYRFAVWIAPVVVFFAARAACRALQRSERIQQVQEEAEEEGRLVGRQP
jgi:ubiquinol-cytochrome c reductase cytochrome b subunit